MFNAPYTADHCTELNIQYIASILPTSMFQHIYRIPEGLKKTINSLDTHTLSAFETLNFLS